jgi:hypothetical protein
MRSVHVTLRKAHANAVIAHRQRTNARHGLRMAAAALTAVASKDEFEHD